MNLMKYFNYNYMIQNLKKSKSILILFLGLIPVLSIIMFLILVNNNSFNSISLETISIIHYVGLYFIPIMISMCLFGFIFKKKSVDFINSMPLSRKTIFTTNTITGIILLILMVVLSGLGIYITSFFTNIILPFRMILDYIISWNISYIFVFTLANIATSVSGNGITQIIVTILLMFFVPFTMDYINSGDSIIYGYRNDTICFESENHIDSVCYYNYYGSDDTASYTLPYNNVHNILMGSDNYSLLNYISLIKMLIISVVSFIVGRILFLKRKMETNETTFSSLKIHNLVKALTMYPVVLVMSVFAINDSMSTLGAICCLLFLVIYFFIYDLITRRSISNVKTSLIHLCVIIIVLFSYATLVNGYLYSGSNSRNIYVDNSDIDGYKLSLASYDLSEFNYVNVTDKKSIEMITDVLMERNSYESNEGLVSRQMIVKVGNKEYKIYASINTTSVNEIIAQIESTDDIKNTKTLLDTNSNYAVGLEYENINVMTNDSNIIKEAIKAAKEDVSCDRSSITLYLYNYHDGVVSTYSIDSCASDILKDYVDEMIREENARFLSEIKNLSYTQAGHKGFTYDINNYVTNDYNIYMYGKEIYNFMKKHESKDFTFDKEYISMTVYFGNKTYSYHTNNVSEFMELFNKEK